MFSSTCCGHGKSGPTEIAPRGGPGVRLLSANLLQLSFQRLLLRVQENSPLHHLGPTDVYSGFSRDFLCVGTGFLLFVQGTIEELLGSKSCTGSLKSGERIGDGKIHPCQDINLLAVTWIEEIRDESSLVCVRFLRSNNAVTS